MGRKLKRQFTALCLALALVLGGIVPEIALTTETVQAAVPTYTYNPQKAVAYADKYWNTFNDYFPNYNGIGGDCADFVSQCLLAGGMPMNGSWYHEVTGILRSTSWTYASSLYTYLATYCGTAVELYASSSSKSGYVDGKGNVVYPSKTIHVGDAVFYYKKSTKRYGHAAICVGYDSKGNPVVSAHNSPQNHATWTLKTSDVDHWGVVQLNSKQTISGRKTVSASNYTYTGELWKTIWKDGAGKEMPTMYMYTEASTSSEYVKTASGVKQSVFLSCLLAISEKKQVGNILWGKTEYNGVSGWVMLQKGTTQYARKVTDTSGAIIKPQTADGTETETKVTGLTLDTTSLMLAKGATKTIKVSAVKPSNATTKSVNWSSSNTAVATVDSSGNVKGVSQGTATITATATDGSGVKATCKVTVANALYKITATSVKMRKTASSSATSLGVAISKGVVVAVDTVKTSGKEKWGKVTYSGKTGWFCIYKGKAYATAVTSQAGYSVTKINLNTTNTSLYGKGSTTTLSVKSYSPSNPTTKGVTWSSSNTKIATVTSAGKVTAVAEGTAVITATAKDGSGVTATCKVTVRAAKPGKPTISSVKNSSSKCLTVKLKKVSGAAGYEVQYSTSSKFSSGVKTVNITSTSTTVKGLTKGKKYYVRVRAYKTDKQGKLYGSYSAVKSLKISK